MALDLRRSVGSEAPAAVGLVVALGATVGFMTSRLGADLAAIAIAIVALAVSSLAFRFVSVGAFIVIAMVLPFFVIPVSASGASPTLLEVAVAATIAVQAVIYLADRRERFEINRVVVVWAALVAWLVFAFVLGSRFGAGADLVRLFGRFLLSIALFPVIVQIVRTTADAERIVRWITLAAATSAAIALFLYVQGPAFTFRTLIRLIPYGYPDTRVVRFIEDNPGNPMRATGTGIDPNAFGGMLIIGFILAVGLFFARDRSVIRFLSIPIIALCGAAILLTYSRGAWVGAAVGAGIIIWFRARYLIPFGMAVAVCGVIAGVGSGFVDRFEAGVRLQDAATLQRFDEYRNAIAIIRAHPFFGIGFGDAPSPEFGVGVSSIYLLIGEQAGLIGLALFGLFSGILLVASWRAFRVSDSDVLLMVGAVFVAELVVGLVDHYYFNIRFAHMVGLFWIVAGLLTALSCGVAAQSGMESDTDGRH